VKHRTIFPFQFFEFHFTNVLTFYDKAPEIQFLRKFSAENFDVQILNLFEKNRENASFEIEVELTELSYLKQFLDKKDVFKSLFFRFVRNLESLFCGNDFFAEMSYNRYLMKKNGIFQGEMAFPKPVFGDYMANEAIKSAKREKKERGEQIKDKNGFY